MFEQLILDQARAAPEKTALVDGEEVLTYGALADEVARLSGSIEPARAMFIPGEKRIEFVIRYLSCLVSKAVVVSHDPALTKDQLVIQQTLVDQLLDTDEKGEISEVLFTSGSTGQPKAIALSASNVKESVLNINSWIGNDQTDVEISALPWFHSFGLGRLRCALSAGGTVILVPGLQRMKSFFRVFETHGVTGLGLVPAGWRILRKLSGRKIANFSEQLKYLEFGSSPMKLEEKRDVVELLPKTKVCMHYGLTEASRSCFLNFHEHPEKLASVGTASSRAEVFCADDAGKVLDSGDEGEVCIRGSIVAVALNDGVAVRHNHGLIKTGDIGYLDQDGFLFLTGRKNEIINVAGKKVSLSEVENVLESLDLIEDVACIAQDDDISGSRIIACVVPTQDFDVTQLDLSELEVYKRPTEWVTVDAIPRSHNGKVAKSELLTMIETSR